MDKKSKLEPLSFADWSNKSSFFAKAIEMWSEKKPNSKLPEIITNPSVQLTPIPLPDLKLSFLVSKASGGKTPAQPASLIKKKIFRKMLNFTSKMKETEPRSIIVKETPHSDELNLFEGEKSIFEKEVKVSGVDRIAVTPPSQKMSPTKLQIKAAMIKTKQDSPLSSPSPKLCDSDSSFLYIENEIDENILKENVAVTIASPTPTTFDSIFLNNLRPSDSQIGNENVVVSICDTLEKALKSRSQKRIDFQKERASLINIMEVIQNYLHEMEDSENESTENRKVTLSNQFKKSVTTNIISIAKSPTFQSKKKEFGKNTPQGTTNLSPRVGKGDALNVYMDLKKKLKFLDSPKTNRKRCNDTPARLKRNLQSQLNKLYND